MSLADLDLLSDEEFDALTDSEQEEYIALLQAMQGEWSLQPHQQRAEDLCPQVDELLFGGSAGPGKSEWLLWHAYHLSLRFENHHTLAIRRTYPQLRRTLIRRSRERFRPDDGCRWRASDREWRFDNGSLIEFGHCDTDDDVGQYLSGEYDLIMVDEATELTPYQWEMLRSRCRTTASKRRAGIRPHIVGATNPGRRSHAYFKERFVDATDFGEKVVTETVKDMHGTIVVDRDGDPITRSLAFVPATVMDNAHIDPSYIANLATLDETEQKMYLFGDWDVFEGMFFSEFSRQTHVLPVHVEPEESWVKFRAMDQGFYHPYACVWVAVDHDGFAYVYRERKVTQLTNPAQAEDVLEHTPEGERISFTVVDPAAFAKKGAASGRVGSAAQQYAEKGLHVTRANNDRKAGWSRVREWLKMRDGLAYPEWSQMSGDAAPRLLVSPRCVDLVKDLPNLVFDDRDPEDLDTDGDDHLADALRYGLMTRTPAMPSAAPRDDDPKSKIEELIARHRGRQRGGGGYEGLS